MLTHAYNIAAGGRTLDDIDQLREDEVVLDALRAHAVPDPTTAGDFTRRFDESDIDDLQNAINVTRASVWRSTGFEFENGVAVIDIDGTLVNTSGGCKEGMNRTFKGTWGYHAGLISLAQTREPLFIVNRPGNDNGVYHLADRLEDAAKLCLDAGAETVRFRGDTAFAMTGHFDRWTEEGLHFVFGYKAVPKLISEADRLEASEYAELVRETEDVFERARRAKQPRVKDELIHERGYKVLCLKGEEIAEFKYSPGRCKREYRIIALRKNIDHERSGQKLFDEIRYFFYVTNDEELDAREVVRQANQRCDQENIIEQLKNGVRALHAPVNTLNANWAYMVMAALAWTLKAWMALMLPVSPRWRKKHEKERRRWLRMDFRTFRRSVLEVPAQIIQSGRRLICRFLAWKSDLHILCRLLNGI